eukprot:403348527
MFVQEVIIRNSQEISYIEEQKSMNHNMRSDQNFDDDDDLVIHRINQASHEDEFHQRQHDQSVINQNVRERIPNYAMSEDKREARVQTGASIQSDQEIRPNSDQIRNVLKRQQNQQRLGGEQQLQYNYEIDHQINEGNQEDYQYFDPEALDQIINIQANDINNDNLDEDQGVILQMIQERFSLNGGNQDQIRQSVQQIAQIQQNNQIQNEQRHSRNSKVEIKDASNGLSYTRMKQVFNIRHPRRVKNGQRTSYRLFCTRTGWHCPSKSCRKSDIQELGVGLSVYFKMLKFFMLVFPWFAFLSIPAYFLYYTGNKTEEQKVYVKYVLSVFSLGNIGQSQSTCNYGDLAAQTQIAIPLFCSYGTFEKINVYGLANDNSKCPKDNYQKLELNSQCNSEAFLASYLQRFDVSISRENLGFIVVILDVAIVLSLIISLYILEKYETIEDKEINESLLKAEHFAVVIKKLPPREEFNSIKELKAQLWNHLEQVVKQEPSIQNDQNIANNQKIMNIHFGLSDFSKLKILIQIYNLIKEQLRIEVRMQLDSEKKVKHDKDLMKVLQKIDKLVVKYQNYDLENNNHVINAYVTFRSIQGKERVVYKKKEFLGKWLKVKPAVAPDLIIWENLKVGKAGRCFRILLISFITIVLIVGTFIIIMIGRSQQSDIKKQIPQIDCPDFDITKDQAMKDQLRDEGQRLVISQFENAHNKTNLILSSMYKMFIVSFINTGLVIFVVNVNLGININNFPLFAGEYDEFTTDWYRVIGSTISFTLLFNIVSPHIANGLFISLGSCKRCKDRGCTLDRRKTKQIIQSDYEDLNTGGIFLLEYRYSQILSTLFIIMMYSSGIPVLYLIAFASFFVQYWFDKMFLLKCYQKPPQLNLDLSKATRALMKFSLILHFIIGLYMYSNSSILTPTSVTNDVLNYINYDNKYFNSQRFSNLHIIVFLLAFAAFFLIFLLRLTFYNFFVGCRRCIQRIKDKFIKSEVLSDDILNELNFQQLLSEFKKTKYDLIDFHKSLHAGSFMPQNEIIVRQFLDKLEEKQLKIVSRFQEYIHKYGIHQKVSTLQEAIQKLREKEHEIKLDNRLRSVIYSYDLKDNDQYKGISEVEHYLKLKYKKGQGSDKRALEQKLKKGIFKAKNGSKNIAQAFEKEEDQNRI